MILLFLSYHHPSIDQQVPLQSSPKEIPNLVRLPSAYPDTLSLIVLLHQNFPVSILAQVQSASQKQPGDGTDPLIPHSAWNSRIAVKSLPELFPRNLEVAPSAPAPDPALG